MAAILVMMTPMVAVAAARVATNDAALPSQIQRPATAAHDEGVTTNPTAAPAPEAPAAAPAASPTGWNPTATESRHGALLTSMSAGLALATSAGKFDFMLTGSGSRTFHLNTMNAIVAQNQQEQQATRSVAGELTVLSRSGETLSDSSGMTN